VALPGRRRDRARHPGDPALSIRLGHIDDGADPVGFTDRRAFDLISTGFGPGANGPLTVTVDQSAVSSADRSALASDLDKALTNVPGAASVTPVQPVGNGNVAHGVEVTARVISCAALIMVSVFAAFLLSSDIVVKMLGLGLAVSVLIDATVVRLLLVPAVMTVLGRRAWWTPRRLDRIMRHIDPEGDAHEPWIRPLAAAVLHIRRRVLHHDAEGATVGAKEPG
jgi:uncharacterized membrane protein YdfJ with MMPL/SSD domain